MKVKVYPSELTCRRIIIPPSKSMAHRAIVCASLAKGRSTITNIDYSVDIQSTIDGMRTLGAKIEQFDDYVVVEGCNNFTEGNELEVNCNESGSTLRFFIPIFSLTNKHVTFIGTKRLMERPQSIYKKIFDEQGLMFNQSEEKIEIEGSIQCQTYHLKGNVSSQFISGLLFSLPLCRGNSTIIIEPPFESRSYVDLTIEMMGHFGVNAYFKDDTTIVVEGNQSYTACDLKVEADYSQLGFFAVLGALQGPLDCIGLNTKSLQGDKQIISILQNMGVMVEELDEGYRFHKANSLGAIIDMNNCPDLGPILSVCASYANGKTKMINAGRLRIKESDRIAAMESELLKCGVQVESTQDTMTIVGPSSFICEQELKGHNDHRIVMALAIAATCAKQPLIIDDAQAIRKSYPRFFEDLKSLGVHLEISND